jgi:hypothetical protein
MERKSKFARDNVSKEDNATKHVSSKKLDHAGSTELLENGLLLVRKSGETFHSTNVSRNAPSLQFHALRNASELQEIQEKEPSNAKNTLFKRVLPNVNVLSLDTSKSAKTTVTIKSSARNNVEKLFAMESSFSNVLTDVGKENHVQLTALNTDK